MDSSTRKAARQGFDMDGSKLQFVLAELRFSAALPHQVIDQLASAASVHQVAAQQFIFREGSVHGNLHLVRSGRVALQMNVPGRGAVRLLTLGPGEMVGWSALLDPGRMTASAVAMEDTELVVVPADKLLELCESNHDFGFHLMRRMASALSKRLVATRLQLLDLFADSPENPAVTSSESME